MLEPSEQKIVTALLLFVSVLLIAGITYVYTNRNRRITIIFTLFSGTLIGLTQLISVIKPQLNTHFLGSYDNENLPYIVTYPGWELLTEAWFIWILPVIGAALMIILVTAVLWRFKKATPTPPSTSLDPSIKPAHTYTKTQRLDTFMAIDAARKTAKITQEKLTEAVRLNTDYEVQINTLEIKVKELEEKLTTNQKTLKEEIDTLKLELSAKNKENEYLSEEIAERNHELARAQEMFEKLAALHRKT